MAGCYHDTQDFKSDLDIEVAREDDILENGQDLKDRKCTKNPGHRDFIPFKDLTLEHLPIEDRNREILDKIKKIGSSVVRLVVDKIVNGRQVKEAGTGRAVKFDNKYFIKTNNHVVKTDDEVKNCTVEFHYNDDSRSSVLTSRGVGLINTCPYRDITAFSFHPVPYFLHQIDWTAKSPSIVIMYKDNKIVTVKIRYKPIPSQLKFLSELDLNSSLIDLMFISCPDDSISYLKSCYFKFQPIPSNIQELTAIEIHIDEDDGNSRLLPGDVVTFGDEFVVEISESIFQDEVKKCRLVWNGEVIGRGTRLYFQQIKSSDIFSGVDLELEIEQGRENHCFFEFHPIPRSMLEVLLQTEHYYNICCIGHPHGGIKMVTIGREFGESLERFDNQYRHINQPDKYCQCKEVSCFNYTCKTCQGSSGSPVFVLLDWGSSVTSIHFMGKRVERVLLNGERVENINSAWLPR